MPVLVQYNEPRAKQILDALSKGKPIPVNPKTGYTVADLIELAGICMFAATDCRLNEMDANPDPDQSEEDRQDEQREFLRDMPHAVTFVSELTFRVMAGQYDEELEKEFHAMIFDRDGKSQCIPVKGFKPHGS